MRRLLAAASVAVVATAATAATGQNCQPFSFDPGKSDALVYGYVRAWEEVCYEMSVQRGQRVQISVVEDETIAIMVYSEVDMRGRPRRDFDFIPQSDPVVFMMLQPFRVFKEREDTDYSFHIRVF